jgi:hypothetical protein
MLFWALLAPEQITMRKVDGWQMLSARPPSSIHFLITHKPQPI